MRGEHILKRYKEALFASIRFLPVLIVGILLIYSLKYIDNSDVYRIVLLSSKIFVAFYISNVIYYILSPFLKVNKNFKHNYFYLEYAIKVLFLRILLYIGTAIALTI